MKIGELLDEIDFRDVVARATAEAAAQGINQIEVKEDGSWSPIESNPVIEDNMASIFANYTRPTITARPVNPASDAHLMNLAPDAIAGGQSGV